MSAGRAAAIDLGTNSVRLLVAEATEGGGYRILDDEKVQVRLGEALASTGQISPAAWERTREALVRMRQIAEGLGATSLAAVATSAVREAGNGRAFLRAMRKETGLPLTLISGEEEARLAAISALSQFDPGHGPFAVADLGGGSLEVVMGAGRNLEEIHSLPVGAVVLTERFLSGDPPSREAEARLRRHVRKALREAIPPPQTPAPYLIGSGGTVTQLALLDRAQRGGGGDFSSVQGYELLHADVVHTAAMLARRTLKERKAVPGMNPERADIIVAGAVVLDELLRHLSANAVRVNWQGIRGGLILKALRKRGPRPKQRSWRSAAEEFARSCRVDDGHSRHVTRLSLRLFDLLASSFALDEAARRVLEAAALLHDAGYFISYASHHKHSYHLIRHASLPGFTSRERELAALVARYHRKALPKRKHEEFGRLSPADQALVSRLAGLLRLADGLDRRRTQAVKGFAGELTRSAFTLTLQGKGDLSVELHWGEEKGDLFEEAFRRRLVLKAGG